MCGCMCVCVHVYVYVCLCVGLSTKVPRQYTCFCGRVSNPEWDPYEVPHTCGEPCSRRRKVCVRLYVCVFRGGRGCEWVCGCMCVYVHVYVYVCLCVGLSTKVPRQYTCFCGRVSNPEWDPYEVPHTGGEPCSRRRKVCVPCASVFSCVCAGE